VDGSAVNPEDRATFQIRDAYGARFGGKGSEPGSRQIVTKRVKKRLPLCGRIGIFAEFAPNQPKLEEIIITI
jgi:hypothetical protein